MEAGSVQEDVEARDGLWETACGGGGVVSWEMWIGGIDGEVGESVL